MAGKFTVVHHCSKCGREIQPNPSLGDRQGGLRKIVHPATTWAIHLCETCVQPLFDLYQDYIDGVIIDGTVTGKESLQYLPRKEEGGPGTEPPTFSA